jgi:cellulose synthase/poly-beta-1,6-N-acetylglucosamine synthase-like glycosyltransferase
MISTMGGMSPCQRPGRPSVAVVIPVFNEETVIERCLAAVLDQTVAAEQIIVVDLNDPQARFELELVLRARDGQTAP